MKTAQKTKTAKAYKLVETRTKYGNTAYQVLSPDDKALRLHLEDFKALCAWVKVESDGRGRVGTFNGILSVSCVSEKALNAWFSSVKTFEPFTDGRKGKVSGKGAKSKDSNSTDERIDRLESMLAELIKKLGK